MLNLKPLAPQKTSEPLVTADTEIPVTPDFTIIDTPEKSSQPSEGFLSNLSKVFKLAFSSIDDI